MRIRRNEWLEVEGKLAFLKAKMKNVFQEGWSNGLCQMLLIGEDDDWVVTTGLNNTAITCTLKWSLGGVVEANA